MILYAVFFHVFYAVSYRDLEEILAGRGVKVDHATLKCWVVKCAPRIATLAQARKRPTASSWRLELERATRGGKSFSERRKRTNRRSPLPQGEGSIDFPPTVPQSAAGKPLIFILPERRDLAAPGASLSNR